MSPNKYLHAFMHLHVTKHQYLHAFMHLHVSKHQYLHAFMHLRVITPKQSDPQQRNLGHKVGGHGRPRRRREATTGFWGTTS